VFFTTFKTVKVEGGFQMDEIAISNDCLHCITQE